MELQRFIEKATPLRILGIRVSKDGSLIAKHSWDEDCRRNIYSASKSVTSCAVGFAIKEGLLSLEEKLSDAFPEDLPENCSEHLLKATVRDLLTMCLGQEKSYLMGADRPYYAEDDWVKAALRVPFVHEPGTQFLYSNTGPYLAGILVQRRAGCDLVSYLLPRLFQPLGIKRPTWETDPLGNTFGAGGLFLTLEELHKFGQFYLQKGFWNGRQLLPESWIMESTRKQVENTINSYGYGYLFWGTEKGAFEANGKYGQLSIIVRDKNAVISTLAECRETEKLTRVIFDEIYPQL